MEVLSRETWVVQVPKQKQQLLYERRSHACAHLKHVWASLRADVHPRKISANEMPNHLRREDRAQHTGVDRKRPPSGDGGGRVQARCQILRLYCYSSGLSCLATYACPSSRVPEPGCCDVIVIAFHDMSGLPRSSRCCTAPAEAPAASPASPRRSGRRSETGWQDTRYRIDGTEERDNDDDDDDDDEKQNKPKNAAKSHSTVTEVDGYATMELRPFNGAEVDGTGTPR